MSYIHGPAIILAAGKYYYFQGGLRVSTRTQSAKATSDLHGTVDEYLKSRDFEISGKLTGMIRNFSDIFPHGASKIGDSIFGSTTQVSITGATVANPSVVTTSTPHGLRDQQKVTIASTANGTAGLNGTHVATVISSTTFSVPINVSDAPDADTGTVTPLGVPLVIYTKAGKSITFPRSGLTKSPTLLLGIGDIFDDTIAWRCTGLPAEANTTADHFRAIANANLPTGDFNEAVIRRYRYTAALGSEASPYDAIRAQTGFRFSVSYGLEEIMDDNFGMVDIALRDLEASIRFIPSNLSQAQIDTLLKLQGSGALVPGESIAKGTNALVVSGSDGDGGFSATLHKCGFSSSEASFEVGRLNAGELQAVSRRTFTGGVVDSLYTFAVT